MFISKKNDESKDPVGQPITRTEVMSLLREVYDPEIGVNIMDLGLVYEVKVNEEGRVDILMTLTTPACPYGPQLLQEVDYVVRNAKGVSDVEIEITFDPPWTMDMVSEEVRLDMGMDW